MRSTADDEVIAAVDAAAARCGDRVVIAVSGGGDSTALAVAAAEVIDARGGRPHLLLAHLNHSVRHPDVHLGEEAAVRSLADRLGVSVVVGNRAADTVPVRRRGGLESQLRSARYRFLRRVCEHTGASDLWTAHTVDDQIETVAMRLLQSDALAPLSGIPDRRRLSPDLPVEIARPLLGVTGDALRLFLRGRSIGWCDDASNADPVHRRNYVRRDVLPSVQTEWPAVRSDLLLLARAASAERGRLDASAAAIDVVVRDDLVTVDARAFFSASAEVRLHLLYAVLADAGFLSRRDRPSRVFFAPLLGRAPDRQKLVIHGRGMAVAFAGDRLTFGRVVGGGETRYLR
ncbi:MAG: tRNA lysidine(34) synthetase TilS [Spirochaetaceae bacterium]|nr:MAG: tRNA lysidine(34) synthetase TilS [Spirochaetaceae bacterium]